MAFTKMDIEDRQRPQGRNAILVYGFGEEKVQILNQFMEEAEIDELIYIEPSDYNKVIKDILEEEKKGGHLQFVESEDQVIVFNSTSQYQINTFVKKLFKAMEVRPIVAMVTATSKTWKFIDLVEELKREKEALKK